MKKVSSNNLAKVLIDITAEKSPDDTKKIVKDFVIYLRKKRLLKLVPQLLETFRKSYDEKHGIVEAEVRVQFRMDADTKRSLSDTLKKRYNAHEVDITELVDERLIGGMKVRVNDEIYDASVKGRLQSLRRELVA